jgi:hypothetical protein
MILKVQTSVMLLESLRLRVLLQRFERMRTIAIPEARGLATGWLSPCC